MAVDMPVHFRLVQQARGRARSAPYCPVPDAPEPAEEDSERREVLGARARAWLERTARELSVRAQGAREDFDADPQGALDALLCALLEEDPAPALWAGAQEDPDLRADLLDALAETIGAGP
jgi:hypothetical protein